MATGGSAVTIPLLIASLLPIIDDSPIGKLERHSMERVYIGMHGCMLYSPLLPEMGRPCTFQTQNAACQMSDSLCGQAPAAVLEGSVEAKTASGVAAMPAKGSAVTAADSACRSRYWPLSLEPGQNQFTVMVTAPAPMAPLVMLIKIAKPCPVSLCGGELEGTVQRLKIMLLASV